ncbi:MAG: hypothetical protein LBI69_01960 [Puniceicoccales bacterium]|jgi:hypothetical protein|nr:hypothetical protein [Puniceicoccales bacterium]
MTISKFSSDGSSSHGMPQSNDKHTRHGEDFARSVLVHLLCKYPEFEVELRQMYWDRVQAAENRGLPIDVVAIQKDISREMEEIAPLLQAARKERLEMICDPKTRAAAPKLRDFEVKYAESLDRVDAARAEADAANAAADAAEAKAAEARRVADERIAAMAEVEKKSQTCFLI